MMFVSIRLMRFLALRTSIFFLFWGMHLPIGLGAQEIRLSEFQPPLGFRSKFSELTQNYSDSEISEDWFPFIEGDIWVVFVESHDGLSNTPEVVQEVLNRYSGELPEGFLSLNGKISDRDLEVALFFSDGFDAPRGQFGCRAAVFLAAGLAFLDREVARAELNSCDVTQK